MHSLIFAVSFYNVMRSYRCFVSYRCFATYCDWCNITLCKFICFFCFCGFEYWYCQVLIVWGIDHLILCGFSSKRIFAKLNRWTSLVKLINYIKKNNTWRQCHSNCDCQETRRKLLLMCTVSDRFNAILSIVVF